VATAAIQENKKKISRTSAMGLDGAALKLGMDIDPAQRLYVPPASFATTPTWISGPRHREGQHLFDMGGPGQLHQQTVDPQSHS